MAARLESQLGGLADVRVGILGLGFRPDVKEHICSPTFLLEAALRARGADVRVHDPLFSDEELRGHGFEPWGPERAEWRPETLVLATGHTAFRELDLAVMRDEGLGTVLDGRRFWTPEAIAALGLSYIATGRADPAPTGAPEPLATAAE